MEVKIINKSQNSLPSYETLQSAGMDLKANIKDDIILKSGERKLIETGLYIELPKGYEAQIRPRSGLAYKHGITVLNSPGTIDSDYRGEIKILLINHSNEDYIITNNSRIAQMVISKHETVTWIDALDIAYTERGSGGFGSTGK